MNDDSCIDDVVKEIINNIDWDLSFDTRNKVSNIVKTIIKNIYFKTRKLHQLFIESNIEKAREYLMQYFHTLYRHLSKVNELFDNSCAGQEKNLIEFSILILMDLSFNSDLDNLIEYLAQKPFKENDVLYAIICETMSQETKEVVSDAVHKRINGMKGFLVFKDVF